MRSVFAGEDRANCHQRASAKVDDARRGGCRAPGPPKARGSRGGRAAGAARTRAGAGWRGKEREMLRRAEALTWLCRAARRTRAGAWRLQGGRRGSGRRMMPCRLRRRAGAWRGWDGRCDAQRRGPPALRSEGEAARLAFAGPAAPAGRRRRLDGERGAQRSRARRAQAPGRLQEGCEALTRFAGVARARRGTGRASPAMADAASTGSASRA